MQQTSQTRAFRPSAYGTVDRPERLEGEARRIRVEAYCQLAGKGFRLFEGDEFESLVCEQERLLSSGR